VIATAEARQADEARTEASATSVACYGYKDLEGSNDRRNKLAGLARELNQRCWPAPAP
jgi:hypothetical protein